jgi:F1F0 ATPase subunit 2
MLDGLALDARGMIPLVLAGYLGLGLLLGAAYFALLRRNVRLFTASASPVLPIGLQIARFGTLAALLTPVALAGALPLLAALSGLLVTRAIAIRRCGSVVA